jgi:hypothetical protein
MLARVLGATVDRTEPAAAPPRRWRRPRRNQRRVLRLAAGLLVAVALGAGWAALRASPPTFRAAATGLTAPSPAPQPTATRSAPPRVSSERFTNPSALTAAYVARTGGIRGGTGPARCARGEPEERSWSRPSSPERVAGRYHCAVVRGRARIVWTDDARLFLGEARARGPMPLPALWNWWLRAADADH